MNRHDKDFLKLRWLIMLICLGSVLAAFVIIELFDRTTLTGPNCPGRAPEWIGYCADAPVHQ